MLVFFFKQKTAYEITEGDWSSDVCSSDLGVERWSVEALREPGEGLAPDASLPRVRSEEHTSELQSPSVTSYGVFCLKEEKDEEEVVDGGGGGWGRAVDGGGGMG